MAERGRPRSFDRQAALERAMDVFWERGYHAAAMSDLTEAMGINSPSLYAAFGSEPAGDGGADSAAAAGDERTLSSKA